MPMNCECSCFWFLNNGLCAWSKGMTSWAWESDSCAWNIGLKPLLIPSSCVFMPMNMHELGMNRAWTVHKVTMIVSMKSMKYGPKFPNFMGVARENLLCFKHEHGHVHAQEPWTIFAWPACWHAGKVRIKQTRLCRSNVPPQQRITF